MLRITAISNETSSTMVRLEGKLLGPWVEEVRHTCAALSPKHPLHLDLAAVTFVDAAGARLLYDLLEQGAVLAASSGFVTALLERERPR